MLKVRWRTRAEAKMVAGAREVAVGTRRAGELMAGVIAHACFLLLSYTLHAQIVAMRCDPAERCALCCRFFLPGSEASSSFAHSLSCLCARAYRLRGYFEVPPGNQVTLCCNRLFSAESLESTLAHELVHAHDHLQRGLNFRE